MPLDILESVRPLQIFVLRFIFRVRVIEANGREE